MQTTEDRLERLEKHNRRLTTALTLMAVAMCAVVTMAAAELKNAEFDTVTARYILVKNHAGDDVISMGSLHGDGFVWTYSAEGKELVRLSSTVNDAGKVTTYQPNGKELVDLSAGDEGGVVNVYNKTGEGIAQMAADEYGNGVVGAYNRKGMGRTLQPGP